ncbi:MAG: valine--tRNA ligase [Lachnospiraceae bacterium]|jgi:valyl-tRNA synthetase|nr:valine--tRNA ligase [Lachnospiraceae bacterium]
MKELEKNYNPEEIEDKIYKMWLDGKYFHARPNPAKKPFTIVMPPPNITGQLHMGHALDNTIQDILIRYKRMAGYEALWQPGTDHAAIATEVKVIDKLRGEGIDKADLGREKFLEACWEWRKEYGSIIINQLHKLGSSADWDRERFTMDEGCSDAVLEVFVKLYEKGYIYRGSRIINWCPVCGTSISDAEVEHKEQDGYFWYIRYPVVGAVPAAPAQYVVIATTRPETLLGDTAVAVNPTDERYTQLVGKMLKLPLTGRVIPVIADDYVDKEFGTGCVKITPAHDPNDFEVGKRHGLPEVCILHDDATVDLPGSPYDGMDRYEARKAIVRDLEEAGLLVKTEPHKHNVGEHDRCGTTIEPMIKPQWFVKMEEMAKPAIEAYRNGTLSIVPESFGKIYLNWLENIRDWCISRQLWWGHRIPAYTCTSCGEMTVAKAMPGSCPHCGGAKLLQDEDTLDTWFSSALWPFSTLGWPARTKDLEYFYPTDVLVTGYDIIFFWVIRMVFSGIEQTGELPFHTVLIHGLVRDEQGRKMSKSLGNGIDPLEVIEKYGADALRMTLTAGNAPGNDMRFYWKKVESCRNFANKLWNATRFIMMYSGDGAGSWAGPDTCKTAIGDRTGNGGAESDGAGSWAGPDTGKPAIGEGTGNGGAESDGAVTVGTGEMGGHVGGSGALPAGLEVTDLWILSKANRLAAEVTENLDKYELGMALQKVESFIWDELCDWYIEMAKPRLWESMPGGSDARGGEAAEAAWAAGQTDAGEPGVAVPGDGITCDGGAGGVPGKAQSQAQGQARAAALWTLHTVLIRSLKLLHPFMPFITEEIFTNIQDQEASIMVSDWPVFDAGWDFPAQEQAVDAIKEAVRAIRNVRMNMNVPASKKVKVVVVSEDGALLRMFSDNRDVFALLGAAGETVFAASKEDAGADVGGDAVSAVIPGAVLYMPFAQLVDVRKEIERMSKEKERLEKEVERGRAMLSNERFMSKAPEGKVAEEKGKLEKNMALLEAVEKQLGELLVKAG